MVGVSAGLIPFLEHDDANRALMGSNMQRQAVPLLITEPPIVGTGLEDDARRALGHGRARRAGRQRRASSTPTRIEDRTARSLSTLRKFVGLNERTCLNQKPIVAMGQKVEEGRDPRRRRATQQRRAGPRPERARRRSCRGKGSTSKTPSSSANGW